MLQRFDDAGMTVEDFCRAEGLCRSSFTRWRQRLRTPAKAARPVAVKAVKQEAPAAFVDLGLLGGAGAAPLPALDLRIGIQEVNQPVSHMDRVMQENATLVQQAGAATAALAAQAQALQGVVDEFKLEPTRRRRLLSIASCSSRMPRKAGRLATGLQVSQVSQGRCIWRGTADVAAPG